MTQSPINISEDHMTELTAPPMVLTETNKNSMLTLLNNGVTALFKFEKNDAPQISGGILAMPYYLINSHFHWTDDEDAGSEHSINGKKYTMEMHNIFILNTLRSISDVHNASSNTGNEVVNLSILFQTHNGDECEGLKPIVEALKSIIQYQESVQLPGSMLINFLKERILPIDYYAYKGSLTVPEYDEIVQWFVYATPVLITQQQWKSFHSLRDPNGKNIIRNSRELQPVNVGWVMYCNKTEDDISKLRFQFEKANAPRLNGGLLSIPYVLSDVHFHWGRSLEAGSEHSIDGVKYSMEMHCSFYNEHYDNIDDVMNLPTDEALLMAFFLQSPLADCDCQEDDNPDLKTVENTVRLLKEVGTVIPVRRDAVMNVVQKYMQPTGYYTYRGSFTIPGYNEIVRWVIYQEPILISRSQVIPFWQVKDKYGKQYSSAREIQDRGDREVFFCNETSKYPVSEPRGPPRTRRDAPSCSVRKCDKGCHELCQLR